MNTPEVWIGVVISGLSLLVAFLSYRGVRDRKRVQFAVVSNRAVVVQDNIVDDLEVRWSGRVVKDVHVLVVRIVNTGYKAVAAEDFVSDLSLVVHGSVVVLHASVSSVRPPGLEPEFTAHPSEVRVSPFLFNAADMIEFQLLCQGRPDDVSVIGRIHDVPSIEKRAIPYNPGSGPEGRMLRFDIFAWIFPVAFAYVIIASLIITSSVSTAQKVLGVMIASAIALVLYPTHAYWLVRRRRLWRP